MKNSEHYNSLEYDLLAQKIIPTCKKNGKALDIETGQGDLAIELSKRTGMNFFGLNLSKELCQKALQNVKNKYLSHKITILQGQINELPFESESFDLITIKSLNSVLNSVKNRKKMISEINRVLKPEGQCYIGINIDDTPKHPSSSTSMKTEISWRDTKIIKKYNDYPLNIVDLKRYMDEINIFQYQITRDCAGLWIQICKNPDKS